MKLENQVVSLEFAKKLRELGVKQESLFWWSHNEHGNSGWDVYYQHESLGEEEWFTLDKSVHISAFTVAELGEMLPGVVTMKNVTDWTAQHRVLEATETAGTEADARAKMLIYLIGNHLITLIK